MEIPVIKQLNSEEDKVEIVMLDINDILYVSVDANRYVVYHTENETYFQPSNMELVTAVLKLHKFERLDRGMVVNMQKIKHYDEKYGKVYFDSHLSKESKYATVSYSKSKRLKSLLNQNENT